MKKSLGAFADVCRVLECLEVSVWLMSVVRQTENRVQFSFHHRTHHIVGAPTTSSMWSPLGVLVACVGRRGDGVENSLPFGTEPQGMGCFA